MEIENIKLYKSRERGFGYNISLGGYGGVMYLEHPRGMLGKSQTDYQKESHRIWALDKENNCMTNGTVVWGETHEHPRGFLNRKHKEESKNKTSKTCIERGINKKKVKATLPNSEVIIFDSLNDCAEYFDIMPSSSVIIKLLKTNEPYKSSPSINNKLKEKFKKLVGLKLEYIQKDNSEV